MNLFGKVTRASLYLVAAFGTALANAAENMPGGPAVNQLNFTPAATKIMQEIHWLHWMMLIICALIFIGVFGVMFYSILKHRKSLGAKSASFHESTTVEIIWTVIPLLIVIGMALPATKTVVAMKDTTNSDITIKTTGYQWKWGYDYIKGEGEGISFLSTMSTSREAINNLAPKSNTYLMEVDNEMVVPVGKKIRLITTANDVIHSWTIPAFGVKQDAIPGFVRDTWFRADTIGKFRGQCSELCGAEHAFMPIVVNVVSQDDYTRWVAEKKKKWARPLMTHLRFTPWMSKKSVVPKSMQPIAQLAISLTAKVLVHSQRLKVAKWCLDQKQLSTTFLSMVRVQCRSGQV